MAMIDPQSRKPELKILQTLIQSVIFFITKLPLVLAASLLTMLPEHLLELALSNWSLQDWEDMAFYEMEDPRVLQVALSVLWEISLFLLQGMMALAVMASLSGQQLTIRQLIPGIAVRLPSLLTIALIYGLIKHLLGLYSAPYLSANEFDLFYWLIAIACFFIVPVCVLEGLNPVQSLLRSVRIVGSVWWRLLLLLILLSIADILYGEFVSPGPGEEHYGFLIHMADHVLAMGFAAIIPAVAYCQIYFSSLGPDDKELQDIFS